MLLHTRSQLVEVLGSTTRPVAPSNSTEESLCAQATLAPQTSLTCAPLSAGRAPVSFAGGDVPPPSRRAEVDLSSVAPSNSTEVENLCAQVSLAPQNLCLRTAPH